MMSGMASKERPVDRGTRLARRILMTTGNEIRNARVGSGLSLEVVGRAVKLSHSQVGRIERAQHPSVSVAQLSRIGSVVGLDLSVRFYPGGSPVRDAAHVALLERFRARLSPVLMFRTEIPLPGPGEQRASDGMVFGAGEPTGVEAETRLSDIQALQRRIALKARDGGVDRVILVVAATRGNRLAIREAATSLEAAFPVPGRVALQALANGLDPRGSAIVML